MKTARSSQVVHLSAFAEFLIDCEEDRTLRAVLVGMLREAVQVARRFDSQHPTRRRE